SGTMRRRSTGDSRASVRKSAPRDLFAPDGSVSWVPNENGADFSAPFSLVRVLNHVQPCDGAGTLARHSASGNGNRLKMLCVGSALGSVLSSPKRRASIQR